MRSILLYACCALALLSTACSEDGLRRAFSFELLVEDLSGDPVEGLRVQLHVPINDVSIKGAAKRAKTMIGFAVPRAVYGEVNVLDLDGEILRHMFAGDLPAGEHQLAFDGLTDSSVVLLGTVPFVVEAIFSESEQGSEVWRAESACVLYTGADLNQQVVLGLTDADGRLEVADTDQFPFLDALPIFEGRDETGQDTGEFTLSTNVEIWLLDDASGGRQVEVIDIGPGRNKLEVVWDPVIRAPREEAAATAHFATSVDLPSGPPVRYRLDVCVPNPFN
jgi:hypothetical protein